MANTGILEIYNYNLLGSIRIEQSSGGTGSWNVNEEQGFMMIEWSQPLIDFKIIWNTNDVRLKDGTRQEDHLFDVCLSPLSALSSDCDISKTIDFPYSWFSIKNPNNVPVSLDIITRDFRHINITSELRLINSTSISAPYEDPSTLDSPKCFIDIGSSQILPGHYSLNVGGHNQAKGDYSSVTGYQSQSDGKYSHAEGFSTVALFDASHAEGEKTTAKGDRSHAEGYKTETYGSEAHAEGNQTKAYGYYSHAEGYKTVAGDADKMVEKNASHAEGNDTIASGQASHAEGMSSTASGAASHAEGYGTSAPWDYSHAEGYGSHCLAHCTHSEGCDCIASIFSSHAQGKKTIASNYASHAQGKYNKTMTGGGAESNTTGDAMVIGNGTGSSALSNAFRVTYAGKVYGVGSFGTSGADYAEFFEWKDGNPNAEDRIGHFVTMDGPHITYANRGDYILGIISGQPAVVGNSDEDWLGRWQHDEFGRFIWEYLEHSEEEIDTSAMSEEDILELTSDPEVTKHDDKYYRTITTVVDHKTPSYRFKANPDYDPDTLYVERADRPEWDYVGMMGVLSVYDNGACQVNGLCQCGDGGIAIPADIWQPGLTYRVIERMSDNVIKVVFK